jgi:hypothetical protein
MQIIEDALQAHIAGSYTLTVPALLPLVEGILVSVVGGRPPRAQGGLGAFVQATIEAMYMDAMHESSKEAVISYLGGVGVYANVEPEFFTPERFPEWLSARGLIGPQVLHRHAIMHGVQTDYATKENSLRCFFILDVLSSLRANSHLKAA